MNINTHARTTASYLLVKMLTSIKTRNKKEIELTKFSGTFKSQIGDDLIDDTLFFIDRFISKDFYWTYILWQ